MQVTPIGWTAEERDTTRKIAQSTQISWHRQSLLSNRTFTIGVSTIGGNDIIGINPGGIGSPGNYKYFDESQYVTGLSWERGYNLPTGGLTKAMAEVRLDNTSGRFTPRYMGGNSELYTASYLPRRPIVINGGFNYNGVDQTIPQFSGLTTTPAEIDMRNRSIKLTAADYVDFFENRFLDQEVMFTAQRTDQVLSTLFSTLSMTTAQYDLDYGINIIPFGLFEKGTRYSDIVHKLVEAENGHLYQDESGIIKFENRQHWDSSPYTNVQRVILTGQVIQAEAPDDSHLINVVEIKSQVRAKQANQLVFSLASPVALPANTDTSIFIDFDDPMLSIDNPNFFLANTLSSGLGTDITSSISLKSFSKFARAAKIVYLNNSSTDGFLTDLTIYGRSAKVNSQIYYRAKDDSSVTAYQERVLNIDNEYIQNQSWAASYAQMILNDFSEIEKLQKITIRALPELQLGDLVSWQGRYWRIFDIKATLDPSAGFVQELTLLQRTITSYFRIGISTIGGSDRIAP